MQTWHGLLLCMGLTVGAAGAAGAVPIDFTGTVSNGTFDDGTDSGTNGDLGTGPDAVWDLTFELDAATQDLSSVSLQLAFASFDHNFVVSINGSEVVPRDPSNPATFTPALDQPWLPHGSGLSRLVMVFTPTGVSFVGTPTTGSPSLVALSYAQPVQTPVFQDGTNTFQLRMLNDVGPDASDWALTGDASAGGAVAAEPTGVAWPLALAGLALLRRR